MEKSQQVKYPKFVTAKWVAEKLGIDDTTAEVIAARLSEVEEGWDKVTDKATFAVAFLAAHQEDPGVSSDCRKASGKKKPPPLFALPTDADVPPLPADASAKKAHGYYAECARAAAERGEDKAAVELAMLEFLEYGGMADSAIEIAQETQHAKQYAEFVEAARGIEGRSLAHVLVEQGLYPVEALGEAEAAVNKGYAVSQLSSLAAHALSAEDTVVALQKVAAGLAEASRSTAAHMQISTAPLATLSAISMLRQSVRLLELQQENAEDEELAKAANSADKAALACKDHLVDRESACEARIKAEEVSEMAQQAASQVEKAASMSAKNMAEMKKVQKVFEAANKMAMEACKLATECATFISKLKEVKPNDEEAQALFSSIEDAFQGARVGASKDVEERAQAAAQAQDEAKELGEHAVLEIKTPAPVVPSKAVPPPEQDKAKEEEDKGLQVARQELLDALSTFASKRWDTNLATQTLRRLTDRRKEVIGQLWEAVEKDDERASLLASKFTDQFSNVMDARRRLDAVVRLIGRGENMDPRTAKWFVEGILKLSEAACTYHEAAG